MTDARSELTGRILGLVVSQAVYVAAKLGIPDLLAGGPRSATELAVDAGADPDALYRLLRLLAGHGIFVEQADGRFANSALSELLREVPGSLRALAVEVGEAVYPAFVETRRMVETGQPAFEVAFGRVFEEHLVRDPEARRRFTRMVAARKEALAEFFAEQVWQGDETVVDVGGGDGALLEGLLARRAGLGGIVFDLPQVAAKATERIAAAGLAGRCQVVGGSFFAGVPAGGDVYVLSHVLRAWDDGHAREILGVVRRAIGDQGRLLLVEEVVAPPNQPGGKLVDVLMLAVGGRGRTEPEWRVLLADGGFALTGIRPAPNASILEALPRPPQPPQPGHAE